MNHIWHKLIVVVLPGAFAVAALSIGGTLRHAAAAPNVPVITSIWAVSESELYLLWQDNSDQFAALELGWFDAKTHQLANFIRKPYDPNYTPYFADEIRWPYITVLQRYGNPGNNSHGQPMFGVQPGMVYCVRIRGILPPTNQQRLITRTAWSNEMCSTTLGTPPPFVLAPNQHIPSVLQQGTVLNPATPAPSTRRR